MSVDMNKFYQSVEKIKIELNRIDFDNALHSEVEFICNESYNDVKVKSSDSTDILVKQAKVDLAMNIANRQLGELLNLINSLQTSVEVKAVKNKLNLT